MKRGLVIQEAVKAFIKTIQLPSNLPAADGTEAFPNAIIVAGKRVNINYDESSNTITLGVN